MPQEEKNNKCVRDNWEWWLAKVTTYAGNISVEIKPEVLKVLSAIKEWPSISEIEQMCISKKQAYI